MALAKKKIQTANEKATEKREAKAARMASVMGPGKNSAEPTVTAENYQLELIKALNYYNSVQDSKMKRKWTLKYDGKEKAKKLELLSDYHFNSVGVLIRLKTRAQYFRLK
jgi:hypothetical protein